MTTDSTAGRSRRAVLAAAAAGAAGLAAGQLARPMAAAALDPGDLALNVANATTALTTISQGTADLGALKAISQGAAATIEGDTTVGMGVQGTATSGTGVAGFSATGAGVVGTGSAGTGVAGSATTGSGVYGSVSGAHRAGVVGVAGDTTGASVVLVDADLDAGVYGFANQTTYSSGVYGESLSAAGLLGAGQWGVIGLGWPGILGYSGNGTGVHGHGGGGDEPAQPAKTGVFATASADGIALQVLGKVLFSLSRRVTIGKGQSKLKVTLAGVTSTSMVLATLQQNRAGVFVQSVVAAGGSFTIYLNKAAPSKTLVAYFVIG